MTTTNKLADSLLDLAHERFIEIQVLKEKLVEAEAEIERLHGLSEHTFRCIKCGHMYTPTYGDFLLRREPEGNCPKCGCNGEKKASQSWIHGTGDESDGDDGASDCE